jgi:CheY-like chemotaxis protein
MLQDQMPRGFVVLVVDDDAETVTLLAQLIADAFGCRVLEATSGEEALRIVDSGVDLVFADVVMPKKDGLTLAHLLRRRTPDLPVVLVTGRPDVVDWVIENAGIALLKPYSIERLAAVLSEQLGIGATPN